MNKISKLFHVLHLQIKNSLSLSKLLFRKYLDYLDNLVADVIGWYRTSAIFFWRSSIRKCLKLGIASKLVLFFISK